MPMLMKASFDVFGCVFFIFEDDCAPALEQLADEPAATIGFIIMDTAGGCCVDEMRSALTGLLSVKPMAGGNALDAEGVVVSTGMGIS